MDNAKTQARHWLLAAAVALFAAILCLGLVGCGPSEEEKAKQALDSELSQFVNPSDDEASPLPRLSVAKGFVADSFRARDICRKQGAVGPQERCYGSFSYVAVLSLRALQKC